MKDQFWPALFVAAACAVTAGVQLGSSATMAQAAPVPGTVQHGRATENSLGGSGLGNCSFPPKVIADGMYTAAPPGDYDNAGGCGSYLDVTGSTGRTVRVLIVDKCPECEPGHLDLSPQSFRAIAPGSGGVQQITYSAVRDPVLPGPVEMRVQNGSSPYWIGFLVMNHGNPLAGVEYQDSDGTWRGLTRTVYNYWHKEDGAGPGPFALRLTDVHGRQVVIDGVKLAPDVTQQTGVWMYQGGTPVPTATAGNPTSASRSTSTGPAASCSAEIDMAGSWPDGYQANITVRNDGASTIRPWQVSWTVPADVVVTVWNGTLTRVGTLVTVSAPAWNDTLAPGASVTVGYIGAGAPTPAPTPVQLNGEDCADAATS
jgi:expansin